MAEAFLEVIEAVNRDAVPTLDEILIETLIPLEDKRAFYAELIENTKPGLTHLLFHPAVDGEELKAIADTHRSRHADYSRTETKPFAIMLNSLAFTSLGIVN